MQEESAATAGYHSANAAVGHNEDQMAEATTGALSNLETATAAGRGVVEALTQANSRSWRTTQTSCGNSRIYSRRNALKSVANAVSTLHPDIIVGHMAKKLVALTRVSLVNSRDPATKRRPLEQITWEVVRPTGNDIQGRQL
jgi:hypothetical protein